MRGLLMIEPLYHQTVKGNKTMTRRSGGLDAVNGRKATKTKPAIITNPDDWEVIARTHDDSGDEKPIGTYSVTFKNKKNNRTEVCFARYRFGEVLFLKEPYILLKSDSVDFWNGYAYKFGARPGTATSDRGCELGGTDFKFENKLFMPAEAGREFIINTGIKCERLLNISDEDCIAEGIEKYPNSEWFTFYQKGDFSSAASPKISFCSLYQFANKMNPSAPIPNLWVWAYTFEYLPNYKP